MLLRVGLLTAALAALPAQAGPAGLGALLGSARVLDHQTVIVATADPHAADMCRGFDLTESQILQFFRKAQPLAPTLVQQQFRQAACEVEGHLLYREQKIPFLINAAATGEIELSAGQPLYFGCTTCKTLFDYGYPVPAAVSVPAAASGGVAATSPL